MDGKTEWLSAEARELIDEKSEEGESPSDTIERLLSDPIEQVDWSMLPDDVLSEAELDDFVDRKIREASR